MCSLLEEGVKVVEALGPEEGDEADKPKATVECYNCHKLGHF